DDRAIVLVAEDNDHQQRIGADECGALFEQNLIGPLLKGESSIAHYLLVWVGFDQEAVPRFLSCLMAATDLASGRHVVLKAHDEAADFAIARRILTAS